MATAQLSTSEDIYKFKVKMNYPRGASRILEIPGTCSLAEFADTITQAFDFDMNHAYGFFDDLKSVFNSTEIYTLFYDMGIPTSPDERSVTKTMIQNVFVPEKKMLFYYDYDDEWRFLVICLEINKSEPGIDYPRVVTKKRVAPPQYRYD